MARSLKAIPNLDWLLNGLTIYVTLAFVNPNPKLCINHSCPCTRHSKLGCIKSLILEKLPISLKGISNPVLFVPPVKKGIIF